LYPFYISSRPFDPYILIHIRQVGDFTEALPNAYKTPGRADYDIFRPDAGDNTVSVIQIIQALELPDI